MKLVAKDGPFVGEVELPVSKSIANRYLIISALAPPPTPPRKGGEQAPLPSASPQRGESVLRTKVGGMHQLSPLKGGVPRSGEGVFYSPPLEGLGEVILPEDVRILLEALNSNSSEINIGMAGTAMRFLTAFCAVQEGRTVVLTGAERMKQRPIAELVDALRKLGTEIDYLENEGFPPLRTTGKKLKGGEVEIPASVSSQFISALMMVGPTMENGLQIHLAGRVLSKPYIELTADCMRNCGVDVRFEGNSISIPPSEYRIPKLKIESDWTSASYFYALAAARPNSKLLLKGLKINSPQGDSILADLFAEMGVSSVQKQNGVEIWSLEKVDFPTDIDFTDHPDLAQTFAFLAATLGKPLILTGLDNLRLKETDRVKAMKWELKKLGISVSVRGDSMTISGSIASSKAKVKTYNDHRMAMSAAVLSTIIPTEIEEPEVVRKSFPGFWDNFNRWVD
ncbi:MAG: 3-phosphoshikimate 1-carboxyvinyltransferase [Flavobacteriales bacterium]|nr:3-phosphoshikimate 1-carboxyvinyltransferase [Flavobacteriales bacterium]